MEIEKERWDRGNTSGWFWAAGVDVKLPIDDEEKRRERKKEKSKKKRKKNERKEPKVLSLP